MLALQMPWTLVFKKHTSRLPFRKKQNSPYQQHHAPLSGYEAQHTPPHPPHSRKKHSIAHPSPASGKKNSIAHPSRDKKHSTPLRSTANMSSFHYNWQKPTD